MKMISLLLVSSFGLLACGDGLGGFLVSDAEEVEIGRGVDAQLRTEYPLVADNDPATLWMREFIKPLSDGSANFRDPNSFGGFKVAVIADDQLVNAFAAPGGFTYISTGLILQASSCSEIAGVMGHELAHVTERHGVKSLEDAMTTQMLMDWILGEGNTKEILGIMYGILTNTQFSQAHEKEADAVGLQIAYQGGYNPYGLASFFEKLLAMEGTSLMPEFLSSHPATQSRIDSVKKDIAKLYEDAEQKSTECVGTSMNLAQLKAHLQSGEMEIRDVVELPDEYQGEDEGE